MDEEIKDKEEVKEAETSEVKAEDEKEISKEDKLFEEEEKKPAKKRRSDFFIELILFLILGLLLGYSIKKTAENHITIGYNDYQMKIMSQDYNINQLQADILKKSASETTPESANSDLVAPDSGSEQAPQGAGAGGNN